VSILRKQKQVSLTASPSPQQPIQAASLYRGAESEPSQMTTPTASPPEKTWYANLPPPGLQPSQGQGPEHESPGICCGMNLLNFGGQPSLFLEATRSSLGSPHAPLHHASPSPASPSVYGSLDQGTNSRGQSQERLYEDRRDDGGEDIKLNSTNAYHRDGEAPILQVRLFATLYASADKP
jgi:hypothetical protein